MPVGSLNLCGFSAITRNFRFCNIQSTHPEPNNMNLQNTESNVNRRFISRRNGFAYQKIIPVVFMYFVLCVGRFDSVCCLIAWPFPHSKCMKDKTSKGSVRVFFSLFLVEYIAMAGDTYRRYNTKWTCTMNRHVKRFRFGSFSNCNTMSNILSHSRAIVEIMLLEHDESAYFPNGILPATNIVWHSEYSLLTFDVDNNLS